MKRVGVVLAGGASRRMGVDKATLRVAGVPLIERTVAALRVVPGVVEIVVVGGTWADAVDLPAVGGVGTAGDVAFVPDRWPGQGPLGGLVSGLHDLALRHAPDITVIVVSCDLPCLRSEALSELADDLEQRLPRASADVRATEPRLGSVSTLAGHRQPLHSAITLGSVGVLGDSFTGGNRRLERAFDRLMLREIPDPLGSCRDADTPEDWERLVPKAD